MHEAISHALSVLSWFENYQQEDIPDENIWDDSSELEKHWEAVRRRRDDEMKGITAATDDSSGAGEMVENDYARGFKER